MPVKVQAINVPMLHFGQTTYICVSLSLFSFLFVFCNPYWNLDNYNIDQCLYSDPTCLQKKSLTQDSNNIIVVDMQTTMYVLIELISLEIKTSVFYPMHLSVHALKILFYSFVYNSVP